MLRLTRWFGGEGREGIIYVTTICRWMEVDVVVVVVHIMLMLMNECKWFRGVKTLGREGGGGGLRTSTCISLERREKICVRGEKEERRDDMLYVMSKELVWQIHRISRL